MKKFAVFDIDGTLIRWQLYHVLVDKLAKHGLLGESARQQLREARMVWKKRVHNDSFPQYEQSLIEVYESALSGITPEQVDAHISEVIDEYQDQVYTYTRDLVRSLQDSGYVLLAISGSHHELVTRIAEHYNFDDAVGTTYERVDGKFTGRKYVSSHHKKEVLEKLIQKHELTTEGSYAVGDSASDAPMLQMVANPIAFNPNSELLELAKANNWPVVVERKNVVYKLQSNHGNYQLVETN